MPDIYSPHAPGKQVGQLKALDHRVRHAILRVLAKDHFATARREGHSLLGRTQFPVSRSRTVSRWQGGRSRGLLPRRSVNVP